MTDESAAGTPWDVRRREIVWQSANLFDEHGYHQTSMDDIAYAVGIRKPSLYHYFKSKADILFWIHEEFIDLLTDRAEDRRTRTRMSAHQQLLEAMADILELMHTHRGHVRVFFEHHRELQDDYRKALVKKRDRYERFVEHLVLEGMETGEFRELDPKLVALAIFGLCNWAYQWYRPDGPLTPKQLAYTFWDLVLHGLADPHGTHARNDS